MKKLFVFWLLLFSFQLLAQNSVFIYSPGPGAGLHIAFMDGGKWTDAGQLCSSDYSEWGREKKMYDPFVLQASDGTWRAVWQVNDYSPTFASAYSADLVNWRPQEYPRMSVRGCLSPVIIPDGDSFEVVFKTAGGLRSAKASYDFRHFGEDRAYDGELPRGLFVEENIGGKTFKGQKFSLPQSSSDCISAFLKEKDKDAELSSERLYKDIPELRLSLFPEQEKTISDMLVGVFFEDISYAADGGLYAELVQNRDFEYNGERRGWNATTAWHSDSELRVSVENPLSGMNPHHLLVGQGSIWNEGWDGMSVKKGAKYDLSLYARSTEVRSKILEVCIARAGRPVSNVVKVKVTGDGWARYSAELTASADCDDASLMLTAAGKGTAAVDMISLFPQDTYKGHGLRRDLAETIEALHPKFVRFPGGCLSHGQGLDNMYHWTSSVGEWQDRKPELNIWNYHQTKGLGFYEFFQWCEDMGAEPLPVLPAGVPCQNSRADEHGYGGQQGGIPMEHMQEYCDEICNLIEWANGDPAVSRWAKMRADAGHPEPFNLKYLGIGNEDLITTVFEDRMIMIARAVKAKYPDIVICGTAGPFHSPSADYMEGWRFAKENADVIELVDEHYYESSGWFLNHRDYYDSYDRNAPKVYLGEYAATADAKKSTLETALAEAVYLCDVERNGDVVAMTSYAPLLCNMKHHNWDPDLIYFDNSNVYTTPGYETQRIFGTYSGDRYIKSSLEGDASVIHRTGVSAVRDSKTGKRYLKIVNANPLPLRMDLGTSIRLSEEARQGIDGFAGVDADPSQESVRVMSGAMKRVGENALLVPAYSVNVIEF